VFLPPWCGKGVLCVVELVCGVRFASLARGELVCGVRISGFWGFRGTFGVRGWCRIWPSTHAKGRHRRLVLTEEG
jgi:hypothetical protein